MPGYGALTLDLQLPCIMGVLNVTPDSFSDDGRFAARDAAIEQGIVLAREGAAIIDIGGESTRPGSDPVSSDDELRRVLPVIEALREVAPAVLSIDTSKAEVARRALAGGARIINDVTALRGDPAMAEVAAQAGCPICLMHMQGAPKSMQEHPQYDDVVGEVLAFLEERLTFAVSQGIVEEQVMLDPGIGFGKTVEHNLLLIKQLDRFAALGRPVVLGASRKRFLGGILGAEPPQRVVGTVATTAIAALAGVAVFRVHDVKPNFEALRVALAVMEAGRPA